MEELDRLFKKWENKHIQQGYKRFIRDGIVDEEWWMQNQSIPKVCFFLKEARTKKEKYDLADDLKENKPWKMWKRVAIWTLAIQHAFGEEEVYSEEVFRQKAHAAIKQIAVVNVKKSNGIEKSEDDDLKKYVKEDRENLKEELTLINPDIIVCGYTLSYLKTVLGEDADVDFDKIGDTMFGFWRDKLVIDYFHPACYYPNRINYYALLSICRLAKDEWQERKKEYATDKCQTNNYF